MNPNLIKKLLINAPLAYNGEIILYGWESFLHLEYFGEWEFRISPDQSVLYLQFKEHSFTQCLVFPVKRDFLEIMQRAKQTIADYQNQSVAAIEHLILNQTELF